MRDPGGEESDVAIARLLSCVRCNYDRHQCAGCGRPLPHGFDICTACEFDDDACADGCDPTNVRQVAMDEDECSACGRRGPIGGAA